MEQQLKGHNEVSREVPKKCPPLGSPWAGPALLRSGCRRQAGSAVPASQALTAQNTCEEGSHIFRFRDAVTLMQSGEASRP